MQKLNVYATVVNINGKKSRGVEDNSSYKHWKHDGPVIKLYPNKIDRLIKPAED